MKPEQLREKFKEVFGVEADHLFIPIFIAMLAPFSCGVNNFLIGR